MQERYEIKIRKIKNEKKEIKQTFRIVQQNTEIERMALENLQLEKEEITEQIQSEKSNLTIKLRIKRVATK